MSRLADHPFRRSGLDDLAEIHNGDAVSHEPGRGQVVRHEHDRHAEITAQTLDEVEDRGGEGSVQG